MQPPGIEPGMRMIGPHRTFWLHVAPLSHAAPHVCSMRRQGSAFPRRIRPGLYPIRGDSEGKSAPEIGARPGIRTPCAVSQPSIRTAGQIRANCVKVCAVENLSVEGNFTHYCVIVGHAILRINGESSASTCPLRRCASARCDAASFACGYMYEGYFCDLLFHAHIPTAHLRYTAAPPTLSAFSRRA